MKSTSDGMDNDTTDVSSEVEDARPASTKPPVSSRTFARTFATPTKSNIRTEIKESHIKENVGDMDRDVYDKCRAWVSTLPERFSGLHNVISIPTETTPTEAR